MAHKKAAGSAKNLRDSNSKYRGVKLFGGQMARAGNIIIRQKGDKFQLGKNVYKGADFTIHAAIDGVVTFKKKNVTKYNGRVYLKTFVEVVSPEEAATKAQAKVKAQTAKVVAASSKNVVVQKETAPKAGKVSVVKKVAPKTEKKITTKKEVAPKKTAE